MFHFMTDNEQWVSCNSDQSYQTSEHVTSSHKEMDART